MNGRSAARAVPTEYVFGYGSLATLADGPPTRRVDPDGFVTDLVGYVRHWGTAMDNSRDLEGYKFYSVPGGGRPAVFVAFLDVRVCAGARVNGVCVPVDPGALRGLDARERNYERIDVTDAVVDAPGRVWVYAGSAEGRSRLARGRAQGAAVIDAGYLGLVTSAFQRLGPDEWARCRPSLATDGLPVVVLERNDLMA